MVRGRIEPERKPENADALQARAERGKSDGYLFGEEEKKFGEDGDETEASCGCCDGLETRDEGEGDERRGREGGRGE